MTHLRIDGSILCGYLDTKEVTEDRRLCSCLLCKKMLERYHLSVEPPTPDETIDPIEIFPSSSIAELFQGQYEQHGHELFGSLAMGDV